jgi:hypothetical protein
MLFTNPTTRVPVIGLSANLRKPDTAYGLENSIGIGFSAPSVGFVGSG